jgi:hypothetical protein
MEGPGDRLGDLAIAAAYGTASAIAAMAVGTAAAVLVGEHRTLTWITSTLFTAFVSCLIAQPALTQMSRLPRGRGDFRSTASRRS